MKQLLYLAPLLFLLGLTTATPPSYRLHNCAEMVTSTAANISYHSKLNPLLSSLSSNSTRTRFFTTSTSVPASGQTIQGLYQCRGDLSLDTCNNCVSFATTDLLQRCPNNTGAFVWYDECLLRFSNDSIINVVSTSVALYMWNSENVKSSEVVLRTDPKVILKDLEQDQFTSVVEAVLKESAVQAASEKPMFVAKEKVINDHMLDVDQIYSMVQCTEDLSADNCRSCLEQAIMLLPNCCNGSKGGRVLFPSCYFRYEDYSFYNTSGVALPSPPPAPEAVPSPPPPVHQSGNKGTSTGTVLGIIIAGVFISVLASSGLVIYYSRAVGERRRSITLQEGKANTIDIPPKDSLQFDLRTVKAATKDFSEDNKLGKGGFGEVHKGVLEDGREIAIKRLSRRSTQGGEEFKNEVMVMAKLQHRNLARLVGFCLEADEKMLIYEFVPNKSLDYFLFDTEKQGELDWSKRFNIIRGIARGIMYLHEDSRLRIIHRDLKSSNILLDGDMNPKISDFGMARTFGVDQAQASTNRIVGTYGYKSPEYAMRGEFSVKSDVYSFGVLLLEIISGRKNNSFRQKDDVVDLISYVWKHWTVDKAIEVMDPTLALTCTTEEVVRCIQIGLLCIQEDLTHRPTITLVIMMLNGFPAILPSPREPGFFPGRGSEFENEKVSALWSIDEATITEPQPR